MKLRKVDLQLSLSKTILAGLDNIVKGLRKLKEEVEA